MQNETITTASSQTAKRSWTAPQTSVRSIFRMGALNVWGLTVLMITIESFNGINSTVQTTVISSFLMASYASAAFAALAASKTSHEQLYFMGVTAGLAVILEASAGLYSGLAVIVPRVLVDFLSIGMGLAFWIVMPLKK